MNGKVLYMNNSVDKGGALSLNEAGTFVIEDGAEIHFTDNSVVSHGGAIFFDLNYGSEQHYTVFNFLTDRTQVSFINTLPLSQYGGNSLFLSVSKYCVMVQWGMVLFCFVLHCLVRKLSIRWGKSYNKVGWIRAQFCCHQGYVPLFERIAGVGGL